MEKKRHIIPIMIAGILLGGIFFSLGHFRDDGTFSGNPEIPPGFAPKDIFFDAPSFINSFLNDSALSTVLHGEWPAINAEMFSNEEGHQSDRSIRKFNRKIFELEYDDHTIYSFSDYLTGRKFPLQYVKKATPKKTEEEVLSIVKPLIPKLSDLSMEKMAISNPKAKYYSASVNGAGEEGEGDWLVNWHYIIDGVPLEGESGVFRLNERYGITGGGQTRYTEAPDIPPSAAKPFAIKKEAAFRLVREKAAVGESYWHIGLRSFLDEEGIEERYTVDEPQLLYINDQAIIRVQGEPDPTGRIARLSWLVIVRLWKPGHADDPQIVFLWFSARDHEFAGYSTPFREARELRRKDKIGDE